MSVKLPLVVSSVEDEDIVEVVTFLAVASEDDQVVVEGVHGVTVAWDGFFALRLQLNPAEFLVILGQVDLPHVVEAQAA